MYSRSPVPDVVLAILSVLLASAVTTRLHAAPASSTALQCEYKTNPLGIDIPQPRLSWQIVDGERGWLQSAYQIRVARSLAALSQGASLVWDSGKVLSEESVHREYAGPALQSAARYYWQVRVWDAQGRASVWSEPAWWEMGLLTAVDWQASWIEPDLEEDAARSNPCPLLRREFALRGAVKSARAYVTSHGLYEMYLNGERVSNEVLTPGWTSYDDHIQYQTYDVTPLLRQGDNAAAVLLGDGWYRGNLGFSGQRNTYGTRLALLVQISVSFADGSSQVITSDGSWKSTTGPILMSDIYDGEIFDARLEKEGWRSPGYGDSSWGGVRIADYPKSNLVAPAGPPVRRIQELKPERILTTPSGETVIDMGQNMVGWLRLKVSGPAGTVVTLRHAEVLDKQGNFYTGNLRAAKQTVTYTLRGTGAEVFEPHFTFQGFRYVLVKGFPAQLALDNLTGIVVHSDIAPAGTFDCSDRLINQLQHNIQWGQKGNFVDVPTDCPQRDERLGWTGDAQAFARTACFNAHAADFYTKWLKDVAADQKAGGAVPNVIPNVLKRQDPKANSASAGWADAAVIVPWTIYLSYGDRRILERQYASMKGWVDYMAGRAGDSFLWNNDFTFGDWLAFASTSSDYPGATTDKDLIMQAYFARSTDLLQKTAAILGKKEDAEKYAALLVRIKQAFNAEFVTSMGRLASNTQTAYSLALAFDLLPENLRAQAAGRLAADVRKFKHITTGFLGAPLICRVLSNHGYLEEAFMLLTRKEYPSWLYPITQGATTIWERWDGIKPDGSFQDEGMNSFNHYAYGAIGEWLYSVVAGLEIDPEQPGYKHVIVQPHTGGGLTYAKATHQSMYGTVAAGWELRDGVLHVGIDVPANTRATVRLPLAQLADVQESGQSLPAAQGIIRASQDGKTVVIGVGSGKYEFTYPYRTMISESAVTDPSVRILTIPFGRDVEFEAEKLIRHVFARPQPVLVRSLDLIHLSMALSAGARTFVATDARLRNAAFLAGLKLLPQPSEKISPHGSGHTTIR
jgi:alpha-L-rhamnosidase